MSTPEWMLKFKEIGQKGEEEVTTLDRERGAVVKIAEPSKRVTSGIGGIGAAPTTSTTVAAAAADTTTTITTTTITAPANRNEEIGTNNSSYQSYSNIQTNPYGEESNASQESAGDDRVATTANEVMTVTSNSSRDIGGSWVVNRDDAPSNEMKQEIGEEEDTARTVSNEQQDETAAAYQPSIGVSVRQYHGENDIHDRGMPTVYENDHQNYELQPTTQQQASNEGSPPQYYVPYDIEEQLKVLYPTAGKRSQMSYLVAVLAFLLIASAILLVVFLVGLDDTDISGQLPTMSPTAFQFPPLPPTSNDNIESAATTLLDPFQDNCNFDGLTQPNILDQCACDTSITILADDVRARWESLVSSFIPSVFPNWDLPSTSCAAQNQALVWMSTGINNGGEIDDVLRLQRYSMAFLYYAQGGQRWSRSENWLSDRNVCTWENVVCDSNFYIRELSMNQNRLSGELSDAVALLNAIETVSFSQNNLFGPIPSSFFENKSLKVVDLSRNSFSGDLPFSNQTNINTLNLENNNFRGTLSSDIMFMSSLTSLNIASNSFTGLLPRALFNISLTDLRIGNNAFSGTIPESLSSVSTLTTLSLGPNLFNGTIPESLADLSNLERLSLIGIPSLNGRLPAQYGISLTKLVDMTISSTSVSGNIPDSFGLLSNLEILRLDTNNLGRQISADLGRLSSLLIFHVNNNSFSGTVPAELGSLTSVREMKFDNNRLSGEIPNAFSSLSELQVLTFDGNFMNGRAPDGVCALRGGQLEEFIVDCPEQVGQSSTTGIICQIPECCSSCV